MVLFSSFISMTHYWFDLHSHYFEEKSSYISWIYAFVYNKMKSGDINWSFYSCCNTLLRTFPPTIHTHTPTHNTHTDIHMHTHKHLHTHIGTCMCTHMHDICHIYEWVCTRPHKTHTDTHACTHKHAHNYIDTNVYAYMHSTHMCVRT